MAHFNRRFRKLKSGDVPELTHTHTEQRLKFLTSYITRDVNSKYVKFIVKQFALNPSMAHVLKTGNFETV